MGNFTGLDTSYDYETTIDSQTGLVVGVESQNDITLAKFDNLHDIPGEKASGLGSIIENEINVNDVKFYLPESNEMEIGGRKKTPKKQKEL